MSQGGGSGEGTRPGSGSAGAFWGAGGFMFLGVFWLSSLGVVFLRSWAAPRRFWSPRWPQLGSILEPCWAFFGAFLGVVLASQLKTVFDPLEAPKTLKTNGFLTFLYFLLARS